MPLWSKTKRVQVGLVILLLFWYGALLFHNLSESERRSLHLQEQAQAGDQVRITIRVLDVDPTAAEMTARLTFRLAGTIATDEITSAADLKLFLNSVRGPQEFSFPRGQRLNPIVAVFATDGNVNRYPLDRHQASIRMLMTRPARPSPPSRQPAIQPPKEAEDKKPEETPGKKQETKPAKKQGSKQEEKPEEKPAEKPEDKESASTFAEVMVGSTALERSEPVAVSPVLLASIPGLKFEGNVALAQGDKPVRIELRLRRADPVIAVSIVLMTMMLSLALTVMLMAAKAITAEENLDLPLSLCMWLLFGLPAMRSAQPGVPPLGAFSDYVSFLWAELLVAASAVIMIWAWLRARRSRPKGVE